MINNYVFNFISEDFEEIKKGNQPTMAHWMSKMSDQAKMLPTFRRAEGKHVDFDKNVFPRE